jgi:SAM-dependent methyltransferase
VVNGIARLHQKITAAASGNARIEATLRHCARMINYDLRHEMRAVYQAERRTWIEELSPSDLDVLEISAGATWRGLPVRSYTTMDFPRYDICKDRLARQFDLIIADQVFEHLLWPYRAGCNIHAMLRPGGYFLMMTPFLVRVHEVPVDCTRWTETGLRYFLAECGFPIDLIRTGSWGNHAAVRANFVTWRRIGWRRRFPDEKPYPLTVWALARKAEGELQEAAWKPDSGHA